MAVIGELAVRMTTKNKDFNRGLKQSQKQLGGFRDAAKAASTMVKAFGAAVAAAAAIGLARMVKQSMQTIDVLAKTSKKLGITTEALEGLRLAAEETGAGVRTLDMGLQRMVRRIAEAGQGTGEAKAALIELKLSAHALAMLAPEQQFMAIAEAMSKIELESDKVRLSFKLFDSEGVALKNTLGLGREELEKIQRVAISLGLGLTKEEVQRVEDANDAWGRVGKKLEGASRQLAAEFAPGSKKIADLFLSSAEELSGGFDKVAESAEKAGKNIKKYTDEQRKMVEDLPKKIDALKRAVEVARIGEGAVRGREMLAAGATTSDVARMQSLQHQEQVEKTMLQQKEIIRKAKHEADTFNLQDIEKKMADYKFNMQGPRTYALDKEYETQLRRLESKKSQKESTETFIADIGGNIGKLFGELSNMATKGAGMAGQGMAGLMQSPAAQARVTNRAIDATTAEGYRALRANKGQSSPQKKLVELTLKQIAEDKKQNVSLGKLVDIVGRGVGDLISIAPS